MHAKNACVYKMCVCVHAFGTLVFGTIGLGISSYPKFWCITFLYETDHDLEVEGSSYDDSQCSTSILNGGRTDGGIGDSKNNISLSHFSLSLCGGCAVHCSICLVCGDM